MGEPYWQDYWAFLDRLAAEHPLRLDRPRGSAHPRFPELVYPLDYGYLEGTRANDGGGVDVWRGSLADARLDALLLTVDLSKGDVEVKLLLGCSEQEKELVLGFSQQGELRGVLIRREREGLALLTSRHSVRRFTSQPVPAGRLESILAAAAAAPSAHHTQPWRFAVLTTLPARLRLAESLARDFRRDLEMDDLDPEEIELRLERSRERLTSAPVVVVLCLDESDLQVYPDRRRQLAELTMAVQSVALAGENLLLAAHALGLGGVWMCAPLFAPEAVRRALDLPTMWQPQGMVLLGYPQGEPTQRKRKALDELVRYY